MTSITAVIVSFNRKELLRTCLQSLVDQTLRPNHVVVVNNASTDGTCAMLEKEGWLARNDFFLLSLEENVGGAGGFAAGIAHALKIGADWVWVMDDDAIPHPDALEKLTRVHLNPANLYGSVAVWSHKLSWPMKALEQRSSDIREPAMLPALMPVEFIPFLGMLISRQLIDRIGLPSAAFFIAKDDVEYSYRARRSGATPILVASSLIEHPPAEYHRVSFLGRELKTLRIPAWKRYYSVRNRILIARAHFGWALYYATLPGSLVHLALALRFEHDRVSQIRAFIGGTLDGLRGRGGCRHSLWGLRA